MRLHPQPFRILRKVVNRAGKIGLVGLLLTALPSHAEPEVPDEGAVNAEAEPAREQTLTVADVLGRTPEQSDYSEEKRCIHQARIRDSDVLSEEYIALRIGRDEYYLLTLQGRCPGLDRGNPVIFETQTSRLCILDGVRPLRRSGFGLEPGARCGVRAIVEVTREQVAILKEELKASKKSRR